MTRAWNCLALIALLAPALISQVSRATAAQAAGVVSTTHYQEMLNLTCGSGECFGDLREVRSGKQVNVTRVACELYGATGTKPADAEIALVTRKNTVPLFEDTPFESSFDTGSYSKSTFNRAVDLQIAATQHLRFVVALVTGTPTGATCIAAGTVDTLG